MLYQIDTEERTAGSHPGWVCTLRSEQKCSAEIWTGHGFNCLRWQVNGQDLLYHAPEWESNPVPTRSGIPILFPFPNRIREGTFTQAGKTFTLPRNDSTLKNAIHGFSPRRAWRILEQGTNAGSAWITGEFRPQLDDPDSVSLWPGDYSLRTTYQLSSDTLKMDFVVRNWGEEAFPFGLGLHPYFRIPGMADVSGIRLHAPAKSMWPLIDNLPSGMPQPIPPELNWNQPRFIGDTQLDTLYGPVEAIRTENGLNLFSVMSHESLPGELQIWTTPDFRENVLFTPVHRQAVCIEPYTCPTDAIHLHEQGHEVGWKTLGSGETWTGTVAFRWSAK